MLTFDALEKKQETVCVVGLGYVGLPLAVLLSRQFKVVGFDVNETRISQLQKGIDLTHEVALKDLTDSSMIFSADPSIINTASFVIVAVPTPVDEHNIPDLTIVKKASEMVGTHLKKGSIVVYESTVYPGVTEEICLPILEKMSGFSSGTDFAVGYSPERVNPGDKEHTIDKVVKVVSGMNEVSLEVIAQLYGTITTVFKATSIKAAEAAKVIENTQRDLNIALMNELAQLFYKMDLSIYDVLDAANTKWNFLPFTPGLVGGHCIGVDPYYLTYKAREIGHNPELILAGRETNDTMHSFIVREVIRRMSQLEIALHDANIVILGATFKENVPDIRNSKIIDVFQEFVGFGATPSLYDPLASKEDVLHEYNITLTEKQDLQKADVLIVATGHDEFSSLSVDELRGMMKEKVLLVDLKRLYKKTEVEKSGIHYWSL
ncbi:MAG: nucleotide sugar dehydrogenase [Candidatus Magasanikbacteria bacterium]|jgi:UDP-N-acetyl-D-glucosamine/UDP-N-acetyl-D-galactosamine dehydrogenase|nr:nucleotide sugar dehydrogenase [Candidatus Magasanikbacteria bacterium]MBT4221480.1 nucleotide sugar dehydrogenase [Candidatus Magasanikbacteria bacterium]MBT4350672.1 nucleotide sugar dehydrogenase [Candidatus Magasanikbacteria bacterium]MBT4541652.1 nucleotide sugar dehydrogenase [Candidatus Magasanikbacteria bacterium]MBT6252905.1 nucleotide sugar dehydrogenase [Candidatus Magasanikbacteria bacterium]